MFSFKRHPEKRLEFGSFLEDKDVEDLYFHSNSFEKRIRSRRRFYFWYNLWTAVILTMMLMSLCAIVWFILVNNGMDVF